MKAPINDSTHNKQDLLLFEYLEGELSDSQKRELEEKLLLDPDLQAEMECWKESFIEQDFLDTTELEMVLLDVKGKSWYSHVSLNVFLAILLIGMLSFLPLSRTEEAAVKTDDFAVPGKEAVSSPEVEKQKPAEKAIPLPSVNSLSPKKKEKKISAKVSQEEINVPEEYRMQSFPVVESLSPEEENFSLFEPLSPETGLKKLKFAKAHTHSVSRKEQRRTTRMKEKALQERMAREFKKGNRAYVVPLNTINF